MSSNIVPDVITTSVTTTNFTVECQKLQLFQGATFIVKSFDSVGSLINVKIISISQEEYLNWNNNDDYIINLMATKLGYTTQP